MRPIMTDPTHPVLTTTAVARAWGATYVLTSGSGLRAPLSLRLTASLTLQVLTFSSAVSSFAGPALIATGQQLATPPSIGGGATTPPPPPPVDTLPAAGSSLVVADGGLSTGWSVASSYGGTYEASAVGGGAAGGLVPGIFAHQAPWGALRLTSTRPFAAAGLLQFWFRPLTSVCQLASQTASLQGHGEVGRLVGMTSAHNALRCVHGAPPLAWDSRAAQLAQQLADQCGPLPLQPAAVPAGYGANVAALSEPQPATDAVSGWYAQAAKYNFAAPPTRPGGSADAFSQLVWSASSSLGCGARYCPGGLGQTPSPTSGASGIFLTTWCSPFHYRKCICFTASSATYSPSLIRPMPHPLSAFYQLVQRTGECGRRVRRQRASPCGALFVLRGGRVGPGHRGHPADGGPRRGPGAPRSEQLAAASGRPGRPGGARRWRCAPLVHGNRAQGRLWRRLRFFPGPHRHRRLLASFVINGLGELALARATGFDFWLRYIFC